ncbi:ABC transporter [Paenibacillus swuensis]|uniref:ABC transporter n=1 Tax=Paenibacillus swuensis TaxID=1178515 RepID=A0A172TMR0_9BACL|nr:ABC-F family ATP-binding cassette domain-containing protein [Paenibacillus swuensis]ANE48310.1 ABC transporter [Paenibacillus swuensis]
MNIVTVEQLSKSYGEKILFNEITLGIEDQDKIGLIGVNGAGKSSFLKALAGLEPADSGKVSTGGGVRIRFLPQNPEFDSDATVMDQIFNGDTPVMKTLRAYRSVLEQAEKDPDNSILQGRIVSLSQDMDTYDAWQLESEAKIILTKLGIDFFERKVGTLSGGQRKRIALAGALIHPCELLILDEPTNHIDNETVDWLEQYLNKRKGALLMITHDRYFLDRVVNRILELDKGNLYSYAANYSRFLELKADREEREHASEKKRQNLLRTELEWIRRGAKARTTKQKARIDRYEKLQDANPDFRNDQVDISVGGSRLGRKIVEIVDVTKRFEERTLIRDFSYTTVRDDRIGIIGPNGSGKSTLLNMIAGRLLPDSGMIDVGPTVKIGYFSQESREMDEKLRVIEYIKEGAEVIMTAEGEAITAAQMLERFLFPPAAQWTPISRLSGGERRRLFLLRVLMEAPNVLLLDEPTNDLDIQTLSVLEHYLDDFPGVCIAVSHDRYFLDRMSEKILAFEGAGRIVQHVGNYSEYQEYRKLLGMDTGTDEGAALKSNHTSAKASPSTVSMTTPDAQTGVRTEREKALKFSFKEQKEYETIDADIEAQEAHIAALIDRMNGSGSDSVLLQQLAEEQRDAETKLEHLLERWTYLNELAEQIEQAKRK